VSTVFEYVTQQQEYMYTVPQHLI